jgi:hypothetical protein
MSGGLLSIVFPPAAIIAGGVILICWLMLIIGPFLCLTAPDETGAKGLIGASILCQLGGFLLSLVSNIGILIAPAILAAGPLLGVIGSVLFVLFMMKIAKYVGRDDLHRKGRNVLIGSSVLFVIAVGAMTTLLSGGQGLGVLGLVIVLIGGLIVFVMYANLINYLSKSIASLRAGNLTGQQTSNYVG